MARGVSGPGLPFCCPFRIRAAVTVDTPIPEGAEPCQARVLRAGLGLLAALGAWAVAVLGGCTGLALTVPQEENEVLGGRLDVLQLLGGVQGLGCLAVPEGWVLFLNWPRGEGHWVSFGGALLYEERLGGASLPGMMLRPSCTVRPSSNSCQAPCMMVGW